MDADEPVRWLGLVVAGGVLVPFVIWFVVAGFDDMWRRIAGAASATILLVTAGIALLRAQSLTVLLTIAGATGEDEDGAFGLHAREAWISVAALVVAIAVTALLLRRDDDPGYEDLDDEPEDDDLDDEDPDDLDDDDLPDDEPDDDPDEDPHPVPQVEHVFGPAETLEHGDEGVGGWVAAVVDRTPRTPPPGAPAILALVLLTVGLAIPAFAPSELRSVLGVERLLVGRSDHTVVIATLADGFITGMMLLLAALALHRRHVLYVAAAFLVLAGATGWRQGWPDSFDWPWAEAIALGLSLGLIVAVGIRLVAGMRRHAVTNAVGAALGIALLIGSSYASAVALRTMYEQRFDSFDSEGEQ